jgi:hypothetical protein
MLPFFSGPRESATEAEDRFLTPPVIILLLLMITFVAAGVYVLVSAFSQ